ncbi:MAG TPA: alpha/beta fold hydrolase [Roseiflexaceae bacterium]|nr:alpha/beta fold hydrolase [Roseiflexaceae bacterium]
MWNLLLSVGVLGAAALAGPYVLGPLRERLEPRALAQGGFVRVGGYELHYTDEGPRDGPPVLLLHGFAAWAFTWRAQRAALARAGFRAISVDQLGYGASPRPAEAVYTTTHQAELMLGVLDALGVARAHVVGHSFGGRIALAMAQAAPGRVVSLALLCPEAFTVERPPVAAWLRVPLLGYALAFYTTAPALVPTGLGMVVRQRGWMTDEAIQGYAAPLRVRGSAAAQVWQGRSPKDGGWSVPERLGEVAAPALLLWGAEDPVFPADDGRKLAALLPDARLHLLDGVGHLPHEEDEPATTAALLEFLTQRRRDAEAQGL